MGSDAKDGEPKKGEGCGGEGDMFLVLSRQTPRHFFHSPFSSR